MKNVSLFFLIGFLAASVTLLSACSKAIGFAPSTTPLTDSVNYSVIAPETSGTSVSTSILFFPLGMTDTPLRDALRSAMDKKEADALIDVEYDYYVFNCLYLFGVYVTEVRGKPIKIHE